MFVFFIRVFTHRIIPLSKHIWKLLSSSSSSSLCAYTDRKDKSPYTTKTTTTKTSTAAHFSFYARDDDYLPIVNIELYLLRFPIFFFHLCVFCIFFSSSFSFYFTLRSFSNQRLEVIQCIIHWNEFLFLFLYCRHIEMWLCWLFAIALRRRSSLFSVAIASFWNLEMKGKKQQQQQDQDEKERQCFWYCSDNHK